MSRVWPTRQAPTEPPPHNGSVADVIVSSGLNALLGLWLMLSPWALGYADEDPTWAALASGAAIMTLALLRTTTERSISMFSWLNLGLGLAVLSTAFWLYDTRAAQGNAIAAGFLIVLLAAWSASATESAAAVRARRRDRKPIDRRLSAR